jgi:hypothetical protein
MQCAFSVESVRDEATPARRQEIPERTSCRHADGHYAAFAAAFTADFAAAFVAALTAAFTADFDIRNHLAPCRYIELSELAKSASVHLDSPLANPAVKGFDFFRPPLR